MLIVLLRASSSSSSSSALSSWKRMFALGQHLCCAAELFGRTLFSFYISNKYIYIRTIIRSIFGVCIYCYAKSRASVVRVSAFILLLPHHTTITTPIPAWWSYFDSIRVVARKSYKHGPAFAASISELSKTIYNHIYECIVNLGKGEWSHNQLDV